MADMKITVLVENTVNRLGLLAEHGLAFWIESAGRRILFDTGQGRVLTANARRLGIRLEQVDNIVLSHGHYDHTGGLGDALRAAKRTGVYAHPAAFRPKYARNPDGTGRQVSTPEMDEQMVNDMARLVMVEEPTELDGGLRLTGPVPRTTDYEDTGGPFFKDAACTEPDDLIDDQAAFMETPGGTIVILGCAHAGLVNTLRYIRKLTSEQPIHTIIGGMHLLRADDKRMDATIAELASLNPQRIIPCHCTGFAPTARLWHEFLGRCTASPVGTVLELP